MCVFGFGLAGTDHTYIRRAGSLAINGLSNSFGISKVENLGITEDHIVSDYLVLDIIHHV